MVRTFLLNGPKRLKGHAGDKRQLAAVDAIYLRIQLFFNRRKAAYLIEVIVIYGDSHGGTENEVWIGSLLSKETHRKIRKNGTIFRIFPEHVPKPVVKTCNHCDGHGSIEVGEPEL